MSTLEIPVKINVKTTIHQQGSNESFELTVFGRFYKKETAAFLQYEEMMEEGTVRTIVKMAEGEALILRSGAVSMRLPFQLHQKMKGSYETPFGRFETVTSASRIGVTADSVDILYDFAIQGRHAGTYHLEITFQEDQK